MTIVCYAHFAYDLGMGIHLEGAARLVRASTQFSEFGRPRPLPRYLTFKNETTQEDTLVAIAADLAVQAQVHGTMGEGEGRHMMPKTSVVIPVGAEVKLTPGGDHIMLFQLRRKVVAGDTVTLYLSLARAGAVQLRAPVVPYAELEKFLGLTSGARK